MGCWRSKPVELEPKITTDKWPYVAFSGGSINGIVYVGAYTALYQCDIIQHLKGAVGTSIGSLFALACVLGMDPLTLQTRIMDLNTSDLIDDSWLPIVDLSRLVESLGICSGDFLQNWVEELIAHETKTNNITFSQLYKLTGKHLITVVFNESQSTPEYWDHLTQPDTSVSKAIRASTSMPLIYEPVMMNDNLYIDGGVGDIFPVDKLPGALGFMVISPDYIKNDKYVKPINVKNIRDHIMAIYMGVTAVQFKLQHAKTGWETRSIVLDGPNKSQWDFEFTNAEKISTIQKAYTQTMANLKIHMQTGAFPVDA